MFVADPQHSLEYLTRGNIQFLSMISCTEKLKAGLNAAFSVSLMQTSEDE
jgi:hypothetical protein